jgi:cytochrome c553
MRTGKRGWLAVLGSLAIAGVAAFAATTPASAPAPVSAPTPTAELPDWLFPIDPNSLHPPKTPPPKPDDQEPLKLPHSKESFTAARIGDVYNPPDWHPEDHGPMPDIVAKGRKPDVIACAFCHTPTGQGRPENAPIAGLPEGYFRQQLLDMRSGARKPVGPKEYAPNQAMAKLAHALKDTEIDEAAKYFAPLKLRRHVWVVESLRIPRAEPAAWIYEEVGGTEDLEDRLIEVTNALDRHERRDDRLEYTAYAPPGSLNKGKLLVTAGGEGGKTTQKCATCHGPKFQGVDNVPPLAGRSPSYLLRQLLSFQHGLRANEAGKQMQPVVEKLELADMVAIAAYLASLYPTPPVPPPPPPAPPAAPTPAPTPAQ